MKFQETETVELKAVAQDGIKKEIVIASKMLV